MATVLGSAPAHGQAPGARWDVEIRGRSGIENGDLRLTGATGRILLQHDDSAFQSLRDLHIEPGRISFTLTRGGRRFDGTVTDTLMQGTVVDASRQTSTWFALPLNAATTRWPVPPRVTIRQLLMGTSATVEQVPSSWLALTPDATTIEREYRELARVAAISPVSGNDRSERARRFELGLDQRGRDAVRARLAGIDAGPAADDEFRRLFRGPPPKIDLHDAAMASAPHYANGFRLATAATGLQLLGELPTGADSAAIREAAWGLWCRMTTDSIAILAKIDSLGRRNPGAAAAVHALLGGYEEAVTWWRDAVHWLLIAPWLETPAGRRSPAQLLAGFWGVGSLPLPELRPTRFGGPASMPVVSALHIGPHLVRPGNASATEWLAGGGMQDAFNAWRPIRWGEIPLTVVMGGRDVTVVSPWAITDARPATFFGERDAILIDPGITPFAAVATFLHEWHHLLAAQHRLSGARPAALVDGPTQLQLLEDDPWLAEGFAEWATEESLRPAGAAAALLEFSQAEKRLAIADRDAEDPHVLGYRLVRAGAVKTRNSAALRNLLLTSLDDLSATAHRLGLAGRSGRPAAILHRPANAAVIPGITFTWNEGTVTDLSRRLVIPNTRSEH